MTSVNASKRIDNQTVTGPAPTPVGRSHRLRTGLLAAALAVAATFGATTVVAPAAGAQAPDQVASDIGTTVTTPLTEDGGPWPWKNPI